ncbi:hypothetical protein [Hymenobacter cheonanensis]|uniref:hypothetical protein n=1 Tax=Hymenobacter sp. CA2-7 TaxID=3063993 RepID=UPI002713E66D|nr:hypothetical protein [Hymenobacter sp. CA2-7]MDO7884258.1 hypothetical protein [Hymenobacter sp. CA2-7]
MRLPLAYLLAVGLLVTGVSACSTKAEPAPSSPRPGQGIHTVDGRLTTGDAQSTSRGIDLDIQITSFPDGWRETLTLTYYKPNSAPTYTLVKLARAVAKTNEYLTYTDNLSGSITVLDSVTYSGTFAGTAPATSARASSVITAGAFTEAK